MQKMENLDEMDNFLDRYQIPTLNQDQINHLNSSITPKEIEAVIKSLSTKKNLKTRQVQGRILSDLQGRTNTNILQTIPQNRNRRNTTQFILRSHSYAVDSPLEMEWFLSNQELFTISFHRGFHSIFFLLLSCLMFQIDFKNLLSAYYFQLQKVSCIFKRHLTIINHFDSLKMSILSCIF